MTYMARLVLFAPREENAEHMFALLSAAFKGGRIDAVIIPLPDGDERSQINFVKALVPVVHEAGAVLLIVDAFEMVARTGADGVHLSSPTRVIEATAAMRRIDRSVGVGGLKARHDAMEAAELGADYVMFGEIRPDGSVPTLSMVVERAEWWAELFNSQSFSQPDGIGAVVTQALAIIVQTPAPQRDE
ncbi:MAG: thiamine phosphate synthase [Alphaproteobacteria bacterium]|nr:thiamine phosphate synthase [Alphaproteobacteria bacterium]